MKTTALFVIALFCVSAYASTFDEKVSSMMAANAMASDAVDTVEALLLELKQSIYDEQTEHDSLWDTQKTHGQKVIAELSAIAASNKATAEAGTAHREYIQDEIQDSHDHVDWIVNRVFDIGVKLEALAVQRCEANQLFIQQLKEAQDALDAIIMLRTDLDRYEASGESIMVEVHGFTSKLQQYEHLFEANAMKNFFQEDGDMDYLDETHAERGRITQADLINIPRHRNRPCR